MDMVLSEFEFELLEDDELVEFGDMASRLRRSNSTNFLCSVFNRSCFSSTIVHAKLSFHYVLIRCVFQNIWTHACVSSFHSRGMPESSSGYGTGAVHCHVS